MTATKLECIKSFKYDGKILEIGDEFVPVGGKWDHIMENPEKGFVREVTIEKVKTDPNRNTAPTRVTVNKKKPATKKAEKFICPDCDREFGSSRAVGAHTRFCKGKE